MVADAINLSCQELSSEVADSKIDELAESLVGSEADDVNALAEAKAEIIRDANAIAFKIDESTMTDFVNEVSTQTRDDVVSKRQKHTEYQRLWRQKKER